jgi:uncharacterized protein YfcZ (UPF0381/DUF406 family)
MKRPVQYEKCCRGKETLGCRVVDVGTSLSNNSIKVSSILSDFNQIWTLLTEFNKSLYMKFSYKSIQWETSCSMRTDRRTEGRTDEQTW